MAMSMSLMFYHGGRSLKSSARSWTDRHQMMCSEGNAAPVLSLSTANRSFLYHLAVECEGKNILTVEGLAKKETGELHPCSKHLLNAAVCSAEYVLPVCC